MKRLALPAALLMVALTGTACGGGDGEASGPAAAPKDASTSEFCGSYADLFAESLKTQDISDKDAVQSMKDFATEMEKIGTPKGISAEARQGFELAVESIKNLPDDAKVKDVEGLEKDYDQQEKKASEAFSTYMSSECRSALEEKLTEQMGDLEKQMQK